MKRILVVNNYLQHRGTLLLSLKESGFDCREAENETTALSMLVASSFDLVIIDLKPPFVEGLYLLHVLNKRALLKTTKTIFMTFNPSEEARNLAKEAGAHAILSKPYAIEQLLPLIHQILDSPKGPGALPLQNRNRRFASP